MVTNINPNALTDDEVSHIVFDGVEDDGKCGDFILVLGFRDVVEDRVPKAVELYKSGRAPKIVFSGAPTMPTRFGHLTEAEHMASYAKELGMPEEDIILDNLALTTNENMICGLLAMQRHMKIEEIKRVLIVSSPQHLKRSYHAARQCWPDTISITLCPADKLISADTWATADDGRWRKYVINEARFLGQMKESGFITDYNIKS